jgi:hypothetical protein
MINLVESFPDKHEAITAYLASRVDSYFASDCSKNLKKRYERMRDSIDQKYKTQTDNSFNTKIKFSLTRQRYLARRANIKFNFRNDPLFSVSAMGNTDNANAINMQEILRLSLKHTKFRQTTFESLVDYVSRYGCAVAYTQYEEGNKKGLKTVHNAEDPVTPYQRVDTKGAGGSAVKNHFVHPLNYFQDSDSVDPEQSPYRGFIDTWRVSDLASIFEIEPDNYVKENIEEVIREARESGLHDDRKYSDATAGKDDSHLTVDVIRVWSTINIRGNEDDDTIYYAEIVGGKVIRFQDNPLDGNIVPLTCVRMRRRPEYWWGNTDSEDVLSHENFYNMMLSIKADAAMATSDRLNLYPRAWGITPEELKNRHANGGWIPYDIKPNVPMPRESIFNYQPQDNSTNNVDWVMRELKESVQNLTSRPDLSRGYNQGGSGNKTATAASILASQGDVLDGDMLEVFSYDLVEMASKNMILLQQYLGDEIVLRGESKSPPKRLQKHEFLGDMGIEIESSLQKNDLTELARFQNATQMMMMFLNTPIGANIQFDVLAREMLRISNVGDVDKILPTLLMPPQIPMGAPMGMPPGVMPQGAPQVMPEDLSSGMGEAAPSAEGMATGAIT